MATSAALDAQFKKLMPDTVTVVATGTRNNYGELSYGSATEYTARVEKKQRMIRTDDGDSLKSETAVFIYGDASLALDSELTLPDGTARVIYAIDTVTDETGNVHHQTAFCS